MLNSDVRGAIADGKKKGAATYEDSNEIWRCKTGHKEVYNATFHPLNGMFIIFYLINFLIASIWWVFVWLFVNNLLILIFDHYLSIYILSYCLGQIEFPTWRRLSSPLLCWYCLIFVHVRFDSIFFWDKTIHH